MLIAGHTFREHPHGRACECGRLWTQIAGASERDVGALGIAHYGALNAAGLGEIEVERERIWSTVFETGRAGL